MLKRYKMWHRQPEGLPLPHGIRQDTRAHTRHCLRPEKDTVEAHLESPSSEAWTAFKEAYLKRLRLRHRENPTPFEELAALAQERDVYLGCSCPTKKNPNTERCHTYLALEFMKSVSPFLDIAQQVCNVKTTDQASG